MHQKRGTLCNCAAKIGIFWLLHKPHGLIPRFLLIIGVKKRGAGTRQVDAEAGIFSDVESGEELRGGFPVDHAAVDGVVDPVV